MPNSPFYADPDSPAVSSPEPDANGQAALLLAESILHSLVEKDILTNREAISTVEAAADVKVEVAALSGESDTRMRESLDLLSSIVDSFAADNIKPFAE